MYAIAAKFVGKALLGSALSYLASRAFSRGNQPAAARQPEAGKPLAPPAEPSRTRRGPALSRSFNDMVAKIEDGSIRLSVFSHFKFELMAGLSRFFNSLNIPVVSAGLTSYFQNAAIDAVEEDHAPALAANRPTAAPGV